MPHKAQAKLTSQTDPELFWTEPTVLKFKKVLREISVQQFNFWSERIFELGLHCRVVER